MPDAYEIAQDLFKEGWRVKLSRQDTTVANVTLYDYPISALYHFTTPGGEEFESYGFFEIAKRLGGKFYNEYSSGFCEKILANLVALYKTELNKKPENPKLVVVGQLSDSITWIRPPHFLTRVNTVSIEKIDTFEASINGVEDWLSATGGKKIRMTIEVLGEWEG